MAEDKYKSLRELWNKYGIVGDLVAAIQPGEVVCDDDDDDDDVSESATPTKCHDPVSDGINLALGYQHWKYLLQQRTRGHFGQVLGPSSVSIWVRPYDGKQIVLIGQNEEIKIRKNDTAPTYCADSVVFLAWFRRTIEPVIDKWTVVSVVADSKSPVHYSLDPVSALQVYLRTLEPPVPIRIIETGNAEGIPSERISSERISSKEFPSLVKQESSRVNSVAIPLVLMIRTIPKGDQQQFSALVQDYQIYSYDLIDYIRSGEDVKSGIVNPQIVQDFVCTTNRVVFALRALFAILKSATPNVLFLGTEMQRNTLDSILFTFGFLQVYPSMSGYPSVSPSPSMSSVSSWSSFSSLPPLPTKSSCITMPEIQSQIPIDKQIPIRYIEGLLPLNCNHTERERDLKDTLARLAGLERKDTFVPQDYQILLRGLSREYLSEFWDRVKLRADRKKPVLDALSRKGLLAG